MTKRIRNIRRADKTTIKDIIWCERKVNGRGGHIHHDPKTGLTQITRIDNCLKIIVSYYNLILYIKNLIRKIRRGFRMVFKYMFRSFYY